MSIYETEVIESAIEVVEQIYLNRDLTPEQTKLVERVNKLLELFPSDWPLT